MGVYLARFKGNSSAQKIEFDGRHFIFGYGPIVVREGWMMLKLPDSGVDSTKFEGDLNYIPIGPGERDFWKLPLEGMTVGGNPVDVVSLSKARSPYRSNLTLSLKAS